MFRMSNKMTIYLGLTGCILGMVIVMMIVFTRSSPMLGSINEWNASMEQLLNQQQDVNQPKEEKQTASTLAPTSAPDPRMADDSDARHALPTAVPVEKVQEPVSTQNEGKIEINTATAEQLRTLPGIGPSKAQAIIDYRASNKRFNSVDDLLQVKGIGPKILEKLRPYAYVEK